MYHTCEHWSNVKVYATQIHKPVTKKQKKKVSKKKAQKKAAKKIAKKKKAAKKAKAKKKADKKKAAAKKKETDFLDFLKYCESKLSIVLGRNEQDLKNNKLSDHMKKKCLNAMRRRKHSWSGLFHWFAEEGEQEIPSPENAE